MFFLGRLPLCEVVISVAGVSQGDQDEDFLSISRAMKEIVEDPVDCYWLVKSFVSQFQAKFGDSLPHLVSVYQTAMVSCRRRLP